MQAIVVVVVLCLLAALAIIKGWGLAVTGFVLGSAAGGLIGLVLGDAIAPCDSDVSMCLGPSDGGLQGGSIGLLIGALLGTAAGVAGVIARRR
jgi:hypothetical protein